MTWFEDAPVDPIAGTAWFPPNLDPKTEPKAEYLEPRSDFRGIFGEALSTTWGSRAWTRST